MNSPVIFSEDGAHFRIADSELEILEDLSVQEYGNKLRELPIGKATTMLRTILLAGGVDGRLENEDGNIVVSSDMDGEDATIAAYAKVFDPRLGHAVMDIGRVTVDIIKKNEIDSSEAEPVFSFEILSNAYKWAKRVVDFHKAQVYLNSNELAVLQGDLLEDQPDRGEIALEHQGLWLLHSGIGETERTTIIRVPDHK